MTDTASLKLRQTPAVQSTLTERRDAGHKLLVPYVTGGYPLDCWSELIDGYIDAGADAVEVGIPFSDPVMDGPTIQEASKQALEGGATPLAILARLAERSYAAPLIAMTYYNLCFRMGEDRFAHGLNSAGVSGAILADLPLEELEPWSDAAANHHIETVLLAAPTASDERLSTIAERASGFVYGVGLLGVTGEREQLAESAITIAKRLKQITDKPVLVGVGVSSPDHAAKIAETADGVVVASALIRRYIETGSVDASIELLGELRAAL